MAARKDQQHATGGRLWGNDRVRAQISLQQLSDVSGVSKGSLSLMEHGRLIPTSDEYDSVIAALAVLKAKTSHVAE